MNSTPFFTQRSKSHAAAPPLSKEQKKRYHEDSNDLGGKNKEEIDSIQQEESEKKNGKEGASQKVAAAADEKKGKAEKSDEIKEEKEVEGSTHFSNNGKQTVQLEDELTAFNLLYESVIGLITNELETSTPAVPDPTFYLLMADILFDQMKSIIAANEEECDDMAGFLPLQFKALHVGDLALKAYNKRSGKSNDEMPEEEEDDELNQMLADAIRRSAKVFEENNPGVQFNSLEEAFNHPARFDHRTNEYFPNGTDAK